MRLHQLLYGLESTAAHVQPETEITGITCHSRAVQPGNLFAALPGSRCDGACFAREAVERGAACVLCGAPLGCDLPCITVKDARLALAELAARWYHHPGEDLTLVGVTGTNGKTTTTYLIRHILQQTLGVKTGVIGTVQNLVGDASLPAARTTPDALQVQRLLRQMADAGCTHAIMEVSSHALVQKRVAGLPFAVGVFTNLTEDHLDYHGTMERYCDAKAQLLRQSRRAVCNADDPWAQRMLQDATCARCFYGIEHAADLTACDITLRADGVCFTACTAAAKAAVQLGVPGRFSVYNALGALAACMQLGVPLSDAAAALSAFGGVKGRMEVVPTPGKPYTVLIDYAHTPDALENVLGTVRGFAKGRIVAVFGCGGDREREKRPRMGAIAGRLADLSVVTSDNPRSEDPNAIIAEILPGVRRSGGAYLVEPNRPAAIALALEKAQPEDVVILCGKGHETYQEIGGETIPMDEREIVRSLLS